MKRALCVGIDEYQTSGIPMLRGCVQDAKTVARVAVQNLGFAPFEIRDLYNQRATRDNILRGVDFLIQSTAPGDIALLYFACHGTFFLDPSNDPSRGFDEILVTYDHYWQHGMLRDEDLAQRFARLASGAALICIVDAGFMPAGGPAGRHLPPPQEMFQVYSARSKGAILRPRLRNRSDMPGLLYVAGCGEQEPCVEVSTPAGVGGAFSLCLAEAIASAPQGVTWEQAVARAAELLHTRGMQQNPQLHGLLRSMPLIGPVPAAASAVSQGWGPVGQNAVPTAASWNMGGAAPAGAVQPPAPMPSSSGWGTAAAVAGGVAVLGAGAAAAGALMSPQQAMQPAAPPQPGGAWGPAPGTLEALSAIPTAPTNPIDNALLDFKPDDYTPRLCSALFKVLPFAPELPPYGRLNDAGRALAPTASAQVAARAAQVACTEPVERALWVASAIDTADTGIAVFSGLKSALGLFFAEKKLDAFETDPQQAVDAAVKLLAISYMAHKLLPGSMGDKLRLFYGLPAGQAIMMYYASVEVALPFADNAIQAGGSFMNFLYQKYGRDAAAKASNLIGAQGLQESQGLMGSIIGTMEGMVQKIAPYANRLADTAQQYVPGALNVMDKAAGVIATSADAMPVYRFLGARLAAEAVIVQAASGG